MVGLIGPIGLLGLLTPPTPPGSTTTTTTQLYKGGLYGVRVSVELNTRTRMANVALSGYVLGGARLSGLAWLAYDNGLYNENKPGAVVLDDEFSAVLSKLMVSIKHVAFNENDGVATVAVMLPVLGTKTVTLKRVVVVGGGGGGNV